MANSRKKTESTGTDSAIAMNVLVSPWITEAATASMELNKYVFKVDPRSTKTQIKAAVEDLYKVKAISVNTVSIARKMRKYGRTPGWKAGFKKAVVTLKAGDKIELFDTKS